MIKILVVDDETGICDTIKKTFAYIGFSVLTATTGQKALKILDKERPKIVFLDVLIPDRSGLDLLQEIKQRDPGVIVIMVTAKGDGETRAQAEAFGADEFVVKPFSRNYLRDVVVQKIGEVLDKGGHMKVPSILLVDDEQEFRKTIREFISNRYECQIEEAGDGPGAVDAAKRIQPDVIFLDIKMPGFSGIEVIQEIKKISPQSRMIVLSAWKSAEVVSQAIHTGAADYLSKPVSLAALNEKLKTVLISLGKLKVKAQ